MIPPPSADRGFILPVLLGIVLLLALQAAHSAAELANSTLLATRRQLNLRAFEAGESGIAAGMEQLRMRGGPPAVQTLNVEVSATDSATVRTSMVGHDWLPAGYSAGRVMEARYELTSTGRSTASSRVTVMQGARQLQVAGP